MTLNDMVDEIYVLNLESRQDRLKDVTEQFNALNSTFKIVRPIFKENEEVDKIPFSAMSVDVKADYSLKISFLNILGMAIKAKQKVIAFAEDDVVFRYQLLYDLPILIPFIKETDFDILSMHHYCNEESRIENQTKYEENIYIKRVERKPYCNHFLILKNLNLWYEKVLATEDHFIPMFDNLLTAQIKHTSYVTSKEYAFQKNNYSDRLERVKNNTNQIEIYNDIIGG